MEAAGGGEMLGWESDCVCVRVELFFTVRTTGQQFSIFSLGLV
jgi:hypothetical protein